MWSTSRVSQVTPFGIPLTLATYETSPFFVLAIMSALSVIGYFSLLNGHVEKASDGLKSTSYVHYSSAWPCSDGSNPPVNIRIFSIADHILADYTTALIIGNFHIPSLSGDILLDVIHMFPVPGDPLDSENYDKSLPDFLYPFVHVIGHVNAVSTKTDLFNCCKWFTVTASAFVRGGIRNTTIRHVYPISPTCFLTFSLTVLSFPIPSVGKRSPFKNSIHVVSFVDYLCPLRETTLSLSLLTHLLPMLHIAKAIHLLQLHLPQVSGESSIPFPPWLTLHLLPQKHPVRILYRR